MAIPKSEETGAFRKTGNVCFPWAEVTAAENWQQHLNGHFGKLPEAELDWHGNEKLPRTSFLGAASTSVSRNHTRSSQ